MYFDKNCIPEFLMKFDESKMQCLNSFVLLRSFKESFSYFYHQVEKSVVVLRKRMEELRSELEAANAELENVKQTKETTEQELKGCEVDLSLNETSIKTLEVLFSISLTFHSTVTSPLIDLFLLKSNLSTPDEDFCATR